MRCLYMSIQINHSEYDCRPKYVLRQIFLSKICIFVSYLKMSTALFHYYAQDVLCLILSYVYFQETCRYCWCIICFGSNLKPVTAKEGYVLRPLPKSRTEIEVNPCCVPDSSSFQPLNPNLAVTWVAFEHYR